MPMSKARKLVARTGQRHLRVVKEDVQSKHENTSKHTGMAEIFSGYTSGAAYLEYKECAGSDFVPSTEYCCAPRISVVLGLSLPHTQGCFS
eukprot:3067585-Amphidinium_carterae.1